MNEFKTEIENVIVNFRNKNDYPDSEVEPNKWHIENETEVIDNLIQLFNKHIEGEEYEIVENLSSQIDPIDTGQTLNKTAQDIINILKIKE